MLRFTLATVLVAVMAISVSSGENNLVTNDGDPKFLVRGQKITLKCDHPSNKGSPVTWRKDGSGLSNDGVYSISEDTNTLIISRPEPKHAGDYTCHMGTESATITVNMNVTVTSHETSKNQVEGDPLQLVCDAAGYPYPNVEWFKNNEPVTADERISFEDVGPVAQAKIVIKDLNFNDKGVYKCFAKNSLGTSASMEVVVRVKDKYAALWPFLGICAEVAILCTIICIYEKRRSKPEFEDDNDDKADRKEGHDVRQRK